MNYILMTLEMFFTLFVAELPYLVIVGSIGYLLTKIFKTQFKNLMNMIFEETNEVKRQ